MTTLKVFLSIGLSLAVLILGLVTLYQLLTSWVPSGGWVFENLASLAFASAMLVGSVIELGKHFLPGTQSGGGTKRCPSCRASVPSIASFCRECGKPIQTPK
ncbi:MAG: zinc ribbon domain-containing protein [Candidatus Bathyarchaeia archaeon]